MGRERAEESSRAPVRKKTSAEETEREREREREREKERRLKSFGGEAKNEDGLTVVGRMGRRRETRDKDGWLLERNWEIN